MKWSGLHSRPPAPSGSSNLLAPSSALSLPGLVPCRIRSWGHPPELSSSRAAVRCFQRRSPLGVPTASRVLLRTRVRFPVQLFKLKTGYVALLGLFPSRVFLPSALSRPSPVLPSCGYILGLTAEHAPLQGLSRRRLGLSLSRLPTLLGFVAFWSSCPFKPRFDSGVASEGAWGTSPPPHQPLFESLRSYRQSGPRHLNFSSLTPDPLRWGRGECAT
jgi:hypothetical protein